MTPQIRLRRHNDGHVALNRGESYPGSGDTWEMLDFPEPNRGARYLSNGDVSGPGWSELLVAELADPDGWDGDGAPYWDCIYADRIVLRGGDLVDDAGMRESPEDVRSDALKMLAAVTACEQYRAERETT